ncbi:MAG: metal ABC transporter substrate-binding protein [Kofleriaceae bacterium]
MRPPRFSRSTLIAAAILGLLGCGREREQHERGVPVVAVTIFPIADLAREIAGPAATVITVLPPNASPHAFEPSPNLARELADVRLVLAVGAGLDEWADRLVIGARPRRIALTDGMPLVDGDPHVWLDPILVRDRIVPVMTDALVAIAPASAEDIRARAARCQRELTELDAELRATLAPLASRGFIASHAAWGYFATRYQLESIGVIYRTEGREPSPRELAELVVRARQANVRVVFTQPQLGELGVRALADEIGAVIATLDPLGGVPGRDSYYALLRYDAHELARALGGLDG